MDWMEVSRTLSRGLEDSLIKDLYYKFILKSKPLKILKINKINMTYYRSRREVEPHGLVAARSGKMRREFTIKL